MINEIVENAAKIIVNGIPDEKSLICIYNRICQNKEAYFQAVSELRTHSRILKDALERDYYDGIIDESEAVGKLAQQADKHLEALEDWVYVYNRVKNSITQ